MIKSIIKLGLLLIVGVIVYNYFLGTPAEKAQSQKIFDKGKEVVVSVKDLVASEKEKFDSGKYDDALEKVGGLFEDMKEKAKEVKDSDYLDELEKLDEKRKALQEELSDIKADEQNQNISETEKDAKSKKIRLNIDGLVKKAEELINKKEQSAASKE